MLDIRLSSHGFGSQTFSSVTDVVKHFGCMQAQDIRQAKWCLGSRVAGSTVDDVNKALRTGEIVRTRPMRGTLHYMDPQHVRWMLKLCARKTLKGFVKRRAYLGISDAHAELALQIFKKELSGGKHATREQIKQMLAAGGIPMQKQRVYHLTCYAGTLGVICFGPPDDEGSDTFVLLDEWVPKQEMLSEEEQLKTLAYMYVRSHGPVTVDDLARRTGLGKTICKKALGYITELCETIEENGKISWYIPLQGSQTESGLHLLGGFDEYFLGYKDRSVVTDTPKKYYSVNGIFSQTILLDGRVVGKWKRKIKTSSIDISIEIMKKDLVDAKIVQEIEKKAERFCSFWGSELGKLSIQ